MHLTPKSSGTQLRSSLVLFIIVGNLLFSAIFVMSMGVQVVKSGNNMQQETVETNAAPEKEQKVVTLAQIN
jgi:TRAP-type mannitol/chloroaromatic compound transport system permease large subunit